MTKSEAITSILVSWNPLGVSPGIAKSEYEGYVPEILSAVGDLVLSRIRLLYILKKMGIDVDNAQVQTDVETIAAEIARLPD